MKKRTKPKQAASARTLDRWQRDVAAIIRDLIRLDITGSPYWAALPRLKKLLRSMQRSERR